ncbi:hypothetical protein [Limnohabitans sp.]|uniref:hypothetical protein n=1 Tax=Limnohabitans sp. TaxID=1907725 RepID=UPI00286F53E6|nr:hypothetical protein [Limnohabitans sp.]
MTTHTAQAQELGKHGADYTYAEGSPTYWRNMHSTRPNDFVFQRDPSVWVYTKEVAQRTGMPLEWASDELKGVAAAAFRMEPDSKGPNCGWGGNPKACKWDQQCVLELYFDRQAHVLPWDMRRQVADFYWQDVPTAFHFLPAQGYAPAPNGDKSRNTEGSPNYPSLGRSPFTDPKTGEELGFAGKGHEGKSRVIAYDREMHSRYAFVRLDGGCAISKRSFPNGDTVQLRRIKGLNVATDSPVFHELHLPSSWTERVGQVTQSLQQQDHDFYKGIWNNINPQGDKK